MDDKNISNFEPPKDKDSEPLKTDSLPKIEHLFKGFGFMMNDEIKPKLVTSVTIPNTEHTEAPSAKQMDITEWSRQQSNDKDEQGCIHYFRLSDMEMPCQAINETDFDPSNSILPESSQQTSLLLANKSAGSWFIQGFMGIPVQNLKYKSKFGDKKKLPRPEETFYMDARIVMAPLSKSIGRMLAKTLMGIVNTFTRNPHDSTTERTVQSKTWLEEIVLEIESKRYNNFLEINEELIEVSQSDEHIEKIESKTFLDNIILQIDSKRYNPLLEIDEEIINDSQSEKHISSDNSNMEDDSKILMKDQLFEIDSSGYNSFLEIDEEIIKDSQGEEHVSSDNSNIEETDSKILVNDQLVKIDSSGYNSLFKIDEENSSSNIIYLKKQDVAENGKDNKQPDIPQMVVEVYQIYEIVDPRNIVKSGIKIFSEPTKIDYLENFKDWKRYGEGEIQIWQKHEPIASYYMLLWDSASFELLIHMKLDANWKIEYFGNSSDTCRWMNLNYANSPKGKLEQLRCRFPESNTAEQFLLLVGDCVEKLCAGLGPKTK